jgi:hypothetical protein
MEMLKVYLNFKFNLMKPYNYNGFIEKYEKTYSMIVIKVKLKIKNFLPSTLKITYEYGSP